MSSKLKSNGARLSRLIIDQGTETMRKYFNTIHPPTHLTAVLNSHYGTLSKIKVIKPTQMQTLFPPSGVLPAMPSTSNDYDITLLFILIRNICGLTAPATTGSWDKDPPPTDHSPEADLVRIKNYRNAVYGHINNTGVTDADFSTYWIEISKALVRLGADSGDIARLKTSPLDEDLYISLLNEWYEKDHKIEVLGTKTLKNTEAIEGIVKENASNIKWIKAALCTEIVKENASNIKSIKAALCTEIVKENASNIKSIKAALCLCTGAALFIFFILFSFYLVHSSHSGIEQVDYSYRQNFSNPGFVGREWVFRQIELDILNTNDDVRGVQLVTDPGWGKSAILKRLINSSSSRAVIHENIIGYHFCKYNDKPTRDGERFVQNLVQQISKKIREFREIVQKEKFKKDELQSSCKENPIECFQRAVVEPLHKVNSTEINNSFILIDALDECLEKKDPHHSIILNILSNSMPELPTWVKLIVTSRNLALTTSEMSNIGLLTLKIDVKDQRNEQDLRAYAEQTLQTFYTQVPSMEEKLPLNDSIDLAVQFSKGNFLLLETTIKHWRKHPDKMNAQAIAQNLGDIYKSSFTKRFKEADIINFEPLLEVLLAANSPPTLSELSKILNYHYKNHNTRRIANKLSQYFKSDIDQGPLEFHHQSFAEWLINLTNDSNVIVIQISRGHQFIVDYLFHFYDERQAILSYEELSDLCTHILHGDKVSVSNKRKLSSLNVSEVRDSWKRCILHDLAPKRDTSELIAVFVKQFSSVDILDDRGWTPAMYAVKAGNYENVKLLIDKRANVNHAVKRTFCFFWDFMVLRSSYETNSSMSFVAAYRGYTKIAKLLVREGAKIDIADECGWKPLYAAAIMGHFEIVQLYINTRAHADAISLHHAAARNHTEIVRFLLNTGVRDKCLPCKPGNTSWCRLNLNRFHYCFCETALHVAVSRDNAEMAKLILRYGTASVNCKHGSGRTPLMEAFLRKNTQMVKLLISAGADIDAKCESSISDLFHDCKIKAYEENEWLYSRYCNQPVCYNGHGVIHFSLAHGHGVWKMATPFISKGKLQTSDNASAITAAGIYDQVDFINATTYGNRINSIPNIETMLHYVAVCHSVETLKHLLNSDDLSKFKILHEDGKTLLHFATLGSSKRKTEVFVTQSCASSACVCPNKRRANIVNEKRLETVRLLLEVLISDINKQDKYGRTALHYAAAHGLPTLVDLLVNAGADCSIKDHRGDTALEFALREKPLDAESFLPCRLTSDQVFQVCESTIFDEMASYLLQNATIQKCDTRAKNLLRDLLYHKLPLSLYALFKSGLDVNCAGDQFKRYLNRTVSTHWSRRYDELLEVFKFFEINVEVVCDVPFTQSELHLMAYLGTPSLQVGNLFQPSANGISFPLQRFVESHPKGVEILNECYDKEGYLAIHRAVQGTNLDAVSWFIEISVDLFKKTKSGLTALVFATYNYPSASSSTFLPLDNHRKGIFEKLLGKVDEENHAIFQQNTELVGLSPLHVAGSRGMGMLDAFRRKMQAFPLIYTNSDGIQPIYLAYLYHATNPYISWSDKQAFQDLGLSPETTPTKFPKREAEYHLIYNQFYRTPQEDLKHMLNHEDLFECPGINESLPNKTVIQEYIKLEACTTRCWSYTFEASREFSSNFSNVDIQNISDAFTNTYRFIDISHHMAELRFHLVKMFHFNSFHNISTFTLEKELWRKVTKAHSCAHSCSCFEIMQLLQENFTSDPREYKIVGKFVAQRMGWTDTSLDGDVKYRWPFSFLLKKGLRIDKAYKYLEILSPRF